MNITVPNYEILNFENKSLVGPRNGGSKLNSQSLLKALRQLQMSEAMTKSQVDKILVENGFYANDVFEFLDK